MFYGASEPQSLLAQETRTFFATVETRTAGTWTVRSCTVYNAADVPFAESSRTLNEAFVVSPAPVAECSVNPDCPGTDVRCFCGGSSCQACSLGTKCINYQCAAIECTIDVQCASGQVCSDENKCVASSVGLEPVPNPPPSLNPIPLPLNVILFFAVLIGVPAGLYIYFRARVRVES